MSEAISGFLDATRLLFGLQRSYKIAQHFVGCAEPQLIARQATDGLVDEFDCALARIWLVEPDRKMLRLVASSGMYTRVDGSFARVPMGAFKVGKIAQNRIAFLSNNLAEETWVKDREWAIANCIFGFAGYPLVAAEQVIGVLAVFSRQPLAPEFLEVLQGLCMTVTVALETALRYQHEKQMWLTSAAASSLALPLSEQLDQLLNQARFVLVGTERSLSTAVTCLLLRTTERLNELKCTYCRLTYGLGEVSLEALIPATAVSSDAVLADVPPYIVAAINTLQVAIACLGGTLQTYIGTNQNAIRVLLQLPYLSPLSELRLRVQCESPVLQVAFTQLAHLAGLTVCSAIDAAVPLLTDTLVGQPPPQVLWVAIGNQPAPKGIAARIDLSITSAQLREAVDVVAQGGSWNLEPVANRQPHLSEREQEILALLAQGLRDRDIANQLYISERTVKFHVNNVLTKLNARTRFQALYRATLNGWLGTISP
ncbi:LuxR C-terminal-related transcriptional regulator [Oculatella sp. LEGE 06141]|uniref:LuxR C-terminal-related transcriptional regulator n=1 Tax=Oculatella sp. LEGE 06141 TaxID=1828648 RepID=UPI00351BF264